MDPSPESLDRHPFRIRKRGYDIMQVRKLLREIGEELRTRQRVSDELADESDPRARAEREAKDILARAELRADELMAEARTSSFGLAMAGSLPEEILAQAREEAARIIDEAEAMARERSMAVLAEAQVRLDRLIDRERDVAARLRLSEQRLRELSDGEIVAGGRDLQPAKSEDPTGLAVIEPELAGSGADENSLAAFVKAAVRDELEVRGSGT